MLGLAIGIAPAAPAARATRCRVSSSLPFWGLIFCLSYVLRRWLVLDGQALGKGGARFTGLVYVFIHYSLLVAYMAQGGGLLAESFNSVVATGG